MKEGKGREGRCLSGDENIVVWRLEERERDLLTEDYNKHYTNSGRWTVECFYLIEMFEILTF